MKTKQIIRIFSLITMGLILSYASGCKKEHAVILPEIVTTNITALTLTTATSGGTVRSDGGGSVTERGVCWNTATGPTTANSKTTDGGGTGSFTSSLTGLTPNAPYFLRAYATNSAGTAYGNEVTFAAYGLQDVDGNGYHTIKIGAQEWMKENLKTTTYRDGSAIPNVTVANDWATLSTGAYTALNNDTNNVAIYGMLYNWYAVTDSRQVCPAGWHSPAGSDWDTLVGTLGNESIAGGKMKAKGTLQDGSGLWYSPNQGATNESGFTGLPGGLLGDTNGGLPFVEGGDHSYGDFWSTDGNTDYGWFRRLQDSHTDLASYQNYSRNGKSVRCVKD